jgi:D-sedoheptulose 7-phosphate isomerase
MHKRPEGLEMIEVNWNKYNSDLNAALLGTSLTDLENAVALIRKVAGSNRTVWVIGNGGSAATASHFCVDLSKGSAIRIDKSIRAVPLMDLVPIQSAWSNDNSYGVALEMSIRNFARSGDILFAISGSGQSSNILNALLAAKDLEIETIGLTGFRGGKMSSLVDIEVNVPSEDMQIIEDAHHAICHFISREI